MLPFTFGGRTLVLAVLSYPALAVYNVYLVGDSQVKHLGRDTDFFDIIALNTKSMLAPLVNPANVKFHLDYKSWRRYSECWQQGCEDWEDSCCVVGSDDKRLCADPGEFTSCTTALDTMRTWCEESGEDAAAVVAFLGANDLKSYTWRKGKLPARSQINQLIEGMMQYCPSSWRMVLVDPMPLQTGGKYSDGPHKIWGDLEYDTPPGRSKAFSIAIAEAVAAANERYGARRTEQLETASLVDPAECTDGGHYKGPNTRLAVGVAIAKRVAPILCEYGLVPALGEERAVAYCTAAAGVTDGSSFEDEYEPYLPTPRPTVITESPTEIPTLSPTSLPTESPTETTTTTTDLEWCPCNYTFFEDNETDDEFIETEMPTPAPTDAPTSPPTPEVDLSLLVENVAYEALQINDTARSSFVFGVKKAVANETGAKLEAIRVQLSPGSVLVHVTVVAENLTFAKSILSVLDVAERVEAAVTSGLSEQPVVAALATGNITVAIQQRPNLELGVVTEEAHRRRFPIYLPPSGPRRRFRRRMPTAAPTPGNSSESLFDKVQPEEIDWADINNPNAHCNDTRFSNDTIRADELQTNITCAKREDVKLSQVVVVNAIPFLFFEFVICVLLIMAAGKAAPVVVDVRGGPAAPKKPAMRPASELVRLRALDGVRAVAAIHIVIFHLYQTVEVGSKLQQFDCSFCGFGKYWVQVFFLISGFALTMSAETKGTVEPMVPFLIRRIGPLYPLYCFSLIISIPGAQQWFCSVAQKTMTQKSTCDQALHMDALGVVASVLMVQSWIKPFHCNLNGPAWFLSDLFLFYMLFPHWFKAIHKLSNRIKVAAIVALYLASFTPHFGCYQIYDIPLWNHWYGQSIHNFVEFHPFCNWVPFALGIFSGSLGASMRRGWANFEESYPSFADLLSRTQEHGATVAVIGTLAFFCTAKPPGFHMGTYELLIDKGPYALPVALLLLGSVTCPNPKWYCLGLHFLKIFSPLAEYSWPLFILHIPVAALIPHVLSPFGSLWARPILIGVGCTVSYIFSKRPSRWLPKVLLSLHKKLQGFQIETASEKTPGLFCVPWPRKMLGLL